MLRVPYGAAWRTVPSAQQRRHSRSRGSKSHPSVDRRFARLKSRRAQPALVRPHDCLGNGALYKVRRKGLTHRLVALRREIDEIAFELTPEVLESCTVGEIFWREVRAALIVDDLIEGKGNRGVVPSRQT